jgi:hypothetical protein
LIRIPYNGNESTSTKPARGTDASANRTIGRNDRKER